MTAQDPDDLDLAAALRRADAIWARGAGRAVMTAGARRGVAVLGPTLRLRDLGPSHGHALRQALQAQGLSGTTIINYLRAFNRMLRLNGCSPPQWPAIPATIMPSGPEVSAAQQEAVADWLDRKGWGATADLVRLVAGSGLRAHTEVRGGRFTIASRESDDLIRVEGRWRRDVLVIDPAARDVLRNPGRMLALRRHSYTGHVQRLRKAAAALGLGPKQITLHGLRETFRRAALRRCEGDWITVAALMG